MPDLAFDLSRDGDLPERPGGGAAFRTLLVGEFETPECRDRLLPEMLLAIPAGGRSHRVLPSRPESDRAEADLVGQAERELAGDAVDIVLLDLNGAVGAVLSLVERLRAAAGEDVVFVGILPRQADAAARRYLPAVVDEVVDGPLRAVSLHHAISNALLVASDFHGSLPGSPGAGHATRH